MQCKSLCVAAVGAALLGAVATTAARADIKAYESQLVDKVVRQGDATIAVQNMLALKAAP